MKYFTFALGIIFFTCGILLLKYAPIIALGLLVDSVLTIMINLIFVEYDEAMKGA